MKWMHLSRRRGNSITRKAQTHRALAAAVAACVTEPLEGRVMLALSFAPAVPYTVGNQPWAVCTGDFNNDGKIDLASGNYGDNSVSVILGNGDGTFKPQATYNIGVETSSVVSGDFNGDGHMDLVASCDPFDSVLLANGDGTFNPQMTFASGGIAWSSIVGDFNGDGKLDLAFTDTNVNCLFVVLGNGNGTFKPATTYAVGNYPAYLAAGDFNGDHREDIVVSNMNGNSIGVLMGNGDGTFAPPVNYSVGNAPRGVTTCDLTGNGKVDIIVANSADNTIGVLMGNGNGTFQPQVTESVGSSPYFVATADFDGDGKPDIAVANYGDNTVSVLLGNGDGTFQAQQAFAAGSAPFAVTVGDFNGDAEPDLAVADSGGNTISVLLDTTPLTPASSVLNRPRSITVAGTTMVPVTADVVTATGAIVATYNSPVTLQLRNGTFADGSTSETVNAVAGVATFNNLVLDRAGNYRMNSLTGGLPGNTQSFTIVAAPATHVGFVQPPVNTVAGIDMSPSVIVAALDPYGNIDASNNYPVTLNLSSGSFDSGSPTMTAVAVDGVATFNNVAIDSAGTFQIYANARSLGNVPSNQFTVAVAPLPATLAFTTMPELGTTGAVLGPVSVTVVDASGNPATTYTSTVTLTINGGTFSGGFKTATAVTVKGVATFNNLIIDKAGTYTLTAGDTPLPTATSTSATINTGSTITGMVFSDINGDGIFRHRDSGIAGVTVVLKTKGRRKLVTYATTTTDASGNYSFVGLPAGTYQISEIVPSGVHNVTLPTGLVYNLTISSQQVVAGKNFGNKRNS